MKYKFKNTIYNTKEQLIYNEIYNKDISLPTFSKYFKQFISYEELLAWAVDQNGFKKRFNAAEIDALNQYIEDNVQELI